MSVFRRNAVRMWALLLALALLGGCTSPAVEETPAVLIGTPAGENPDDLGDVAVFSLPNSGLYCQFSTAIFMSGIRYSSTDALPHLDFERSGLEPDIYVANDIDAWKGQYDNALNYILEHT